MRDASTLVVVLGQGDGSFGAKTIHPVGTGPEAFVLGDVDGDGIDDVVTANAVSDDVTVLLRTGGRNFTTLGSFAAPHSEPRSIGLGDGDGDGHADVRVTCEGLGVLGVLPGDGTGALESALAFAVPGREIYLNNATKLTPLMVVHLTGDGMDDALVVIRRYGSATVMEDRLVR